LGTGSRPWKGPTTQTEPDTVEDVARRLRRAEDRIRGVIAMLENGRDGADVVTHLAAASRALNKAGYKIVASTLRQRIAANNAGEDQAANLEQMEKLFLSLA
jgi:DNA-binding FrmR family transcriptional regulator